MKKLKNATFPIIDAVAASIAAFKYTNGETIRMTYTTREDGVEKIVRSSKEIALEYLNEPDKLEPFREQAEEDIQFFQQQALMATLIGKKNNTFMTAINEAVTKEEVPYSDIGILVWMPKMLNNMRQREDNRIQWIGYANSSKFMPFKEGEKVTTEFLLIEKRYIRDKNLWVAIGVTPEGYIVSYFSNTDKKIVDQGNITGKVKGFGVDRYRNDAKVTRLNYVKVL